MNSTAYAKDKPLFEGGFFFGHGGLADYPASDEYRYRTLPFPYVVYNGDFFRSDDENGTRLTFIKDQNFDLDLSFGGSFPTETDNNNARAGMPNLDWTIEFGPRLLYYFYRDSNVGNIRVGVPFRMAVSTDFQRTKEVGYIFAPTFQIDRYKFLSDNLNIYFTLTLNYLSEGEADYFYQIEPLYETPERNSYDAKSGLLGYDASFSAKYEWNQKLFLIGAKYSDFSASANKGSYLHRTDSSWSYFVGLGLVLFESEEKAQY